MYHHSLVIDAPLFLEDLIPTTWTMLSNAFGVDCAKNGSSLFGLHDGRFWMTSHPIGSNGRSQEIMLMGMPHRNQLHHGIHVHFHYTLW